MLTSDTFNSAGDRCDEGENRILRALKLWTEGPPCEGQAHRTRRRRGRTRERDRRCFRDHGRWTGRLFQKTARPVSGGRGDWCLAEWL